MFRFLYLTLVASLCFATSADAVDRVRLGYGRLVTNDFFGDNEDRWRTGSFSSSRVWGPRWTGTTPRRFGELLELRLGAEIITPDNLRSPSPKDRRYAAAVSVGVHSHFEQNGIEYTLGGDLVFVGPQTQLDDIQDAFHDLFNISKASDAVRADQIGNTVKPTVVFEAGRRFALGNGAVLRPFVEGRAGVETLVRAGFDVTNGGLGQSELLVRDPVTGQRYRAIRADWTGYSFVFGADIAHVDQSTFLPGGGSPSVKKTRQRARAGIMWQGGNGVFGFYGLSYLGKEYAGQPEGQIIGSVRLRIVF